MKRAELRRGLHLHRPRSGDRDRRGAARIHGLDQRGRYGLAFTVDLDGDGLSDASEFNMAALGFDWQVAQPALVSTLFTNVNGAGLYTPSQVQALNIGVPLLTKDAATGKFKLTIGVKKTTNLAQPFLDFPMTGPGVTTVINGAGKLEFEFTVPDNAAFFRLQAQ